MAGIQTSTHSSGAVRNVTPSDSVDLVFGVSRLVRCGGAGDISVVDLTGATVIIPGIQAGESLSIEVTRINATGTTATLITVLF